MDNTNHLSKLFLYLFLVSLLAFLIQHKLYTQYQLSRTSVTNYAIPKFNNFKRKPKTDLDTREIKPTTKKVISKMNDYKLEMETELDIREIPSANKHVLHEVKNRKQEMEKEVDVLKLKYTTTHAMPTLNNDTLGMKTVLDTHKINLTIIRHIVHEPKNDKQEMPMDLGIHGMNDEIKQFIPELDNNEQELKKDSVSEEIDSAAKPVIPDNKVNDDNHEMKTDKGIDGTHSATHHVIPKLSTVGKREILFDSDIHGTNATTERKTFNLKDDTEEMRDIQRMNFTTDRVITQINGVKQQEPQKQLEINQTLNDGLKIAKESVTKGNPIEIIQIDFNKTNTSYTLRFGQRDGENTIMKINSSGTLNSLQKQTKRGDKKRNVPELSIVKTRNSVLDRRNATATRCRKLPDILIIGFEKCGTVTLKSFLGIHPQILVPSLYKNYNLFNKGTNLKVTQYTRNQKCTPAGKLRLEKLSTWGTALKTYRVIPKVKLIAIVREPVERTMSHFVHRIAIGKEKKPYNFDKTIADMMSGKGPIKQTASVLFRQSQYIDRLRPWISKYGIRNIHIVDGGAFAKHPAMELQKVERFLGLKPYITEKNFVYNPAGTFYCLKDRGKVSCMSKNKGRAHRSMSDETRTSLQRYYQPYNEDLFQTIGRRFPWDY